MTHPLLDVPPAVRKEDLHQDDTVQGEAPFAPTGVADNGKETFLKMPAGLGRTGAPALFVQQGGSQALVNYTPRGDYFEATTGTRFKTDGELIAAIVEAFVKRGDKMLKALRLATDH